MEQFDKDKFEEFSNKMSTLQSSSAPFLYSTDPPKEPYGLKEDIFFELGEKKVRANPQTG